MTINLSPKEISGHFLSNAEQRAAKAYAVKHGDNFLYLGGRKTWQTVGAAKNAIVHTIKNLNFPYYSSEARELRSNKKLVRETLEYLLSNHIHIVEI